MSTFVAIAWTKYLERLDSSPLLTKACTSALIAALADTFAQRLTSSKASLNFRRSFIIATYGFFWIGPSNHYWHGFLERLIPMSKNTGTRSAKKVAVDQLLFGPLNNILMLLFMARVVDGVSLSTSISRLRMQFPSVQFRGWRLWPAAQFLNHYFMPLKFRVLFTNSVAFLWQCYLISTGAKNTQPTRAPPLLKLHVA
jgi:hypothetical protein